MIILELHGHIYYIPSNKFLILSLLSRSAYVENQFHVTVKHIRSDNGTSIVQETCQTLFSSKCIVHEKSLPGLLQQNGRVERKHKHLLETTRSLRFHVNLSVKFWGECLLTVTYITLLI